MQTTNAMKRLSFLLVTLCLLLFAACAAADDTWMPDKYTFLKPVPAERILTGLPKGMEASCKVTDGMIQYTIDADATDWESVLAYSYQTASGQTYVYPGMRKPEGISAYRSMRYSVDPYYPETRMISLLKNDYAQSGPHLSDTVTSSQWVGRYDEATATYVPLEFNQSPWGLVTLWFDENGNVTGGEYLLYTIAYTDANARTVRMAQVPAADITPNVPVTSFDFGTQLTAGKADGTVRYEAANPGQLGFYGITTAVAAPQIDGKDTSGWTCYARLSTRTDFSPCTMADAGSYGLTRRSALIKGSLQDKTGAEQTAYILDWRDELGVTQYVAQLTVVTVGGSPAPWPYYAAWQPVPGNRLNLRYANPIASGTTLAYNDQTGVAYFHITPDELPETAAYGDAHLAMNITPPDGATAYAFFKGNGNLEFGEKTYMVDRAQQWIRDGERKLCSEGFPFTQPLFNTYRQEGKDLTLYMSAMMPGEFAAEYLIINWYRDIGDAQPMSTEYVFCQMDPCILEQVSTPLSSEDELPDVVTSTAIVIPNSNSAARMTFVAEIYPQEGENARYYELRLLDKNGKMAHLPAKAKIILPYPEGTSFESMALTFNLRHLNSKYQTFETFSVENGNLHLEEDYIWFTPSSLSPFVLEWSVASAGGVAPSNPAAPAPDADISVLPETGDSSWPPAVLAMLAACSIALLMQLRRRRI